MRGCGSTSVQTPTPPRIARKARARSWRSAPRCGRDAEADSMRHTSGLREALQPLFQPAHVAVIGASSTSGKHGNIAIRYLIRAGYRGRISPVNRNGGEVEGLACHRSIKDAPRPVDCALLVVPAGVAVDALREDRKSTRLNSSHLGISYAVFCLKK